MMNKTEEEEKIGDDRNLIFNIHPNQIPTDIHRVYVTFIDLLSLIFQKASKKHNQRDSTITART